MIDLQEINYNSAINTEDVSINLTSKRHRYRTRYKTKYAFYNITKRTFDLIFSLVFLILLSPIMIITAIAVKIDSKGPAFYKQERLGLDGISFVMYKFRSMSIDAERDGACWATKDDPRITRVGKIIRKIRLDELPQLINILKGNMSFVGPRPEREIFYDEFEKYIPGFRNRLQVLPGLTGWAQVNGGYDLGPKEKLEYDMEYIQNRSLILDIKCIFKTFKVVFTHEGAR